MWKLIKTEVEYYRWLYFLSITLIIVVDVGLTINNRWIEAQNEFPGLRIIWIGISIAFGGFLFVSSLYTFNKRKLYLE